MHLGSFLSREHININKNYLNKKVIVKLGAFLFCFTSNFGARSRSTALGEEVERQLLPMYWMNLPEEGNWMFDAFPKANVPQL